MSNEELAQRIKAGEKGAAAMLWQNIKNLVYKLAYRYMTLKKEACTASGVSIDDLAQEAYIAMLKAVEDWDGEWRFTTFLGRHLLTRWDEAAHLRTGRSDALQGAVSFEAPVSDDITLADAIEDKEAAYKMEQVEQRDYICRLRRDVQEAMESLPDEHRRLVHMRFWEGRTLSQCGQAIGKSRSCAACLESQAFRLMLRDKRIRQYKEDFIWTHYRASLGSFMRTHTSAVEHAVILLDEQRF